MAQCLGQAPIGFQMGVGRGLGGLIGPRDAREPVEAPL